MPPGLGPPSGGPPGIGGPPGMPMGPPPGMAPGAPGMNPYPSTDPASASVGLGPLLQMMLGDQQQLQQRQQAAASMAFSDMLAQMPNQSAVGVQTEPGLALPPDGMGPGGALG